MTFIIVNELPNWNNMFIFILFIFAVSYIVMLYIDNDVIYK